MLIVSAPTPAASSSIIPPKAVSPKRSSTSCSSRISRMPLAKIVNSATATRLRLPPITIRVDASE
jgi:hypothetical protein